MAVTEFGTNDAQTVKLWSKMLARETIYKTYWRRFMGSSDTAIIQRISDLEKNRGDEIRYDLLNQMTQYGVTGDNPIKGFEEALVYNQDTIKIDQRRIAHAFRTMSQQRTVHDLRRDARRNLSDRFATILDEFMFSYLAGTAGDANPALTTALGAGHAGNALTAPDAAHVDADTSVFDADVIELANEKAVTVEPLMRPNTVEGEEVYVMVIHPHNLYDLRTSVTPGDWKDSVAQAGPRGLSNPLFTYATLKWANVLIHVTPRIPRLLSASPDVAYTLFLGAQAGCIAFGNAYSRLRQGVMGQENVFSWFEDTDDYGNEMGVAAGAIFGIKKTVFDGVDFGVIRFDRDSNPH